MRRTLALALAAALLLCGIPALADVQRGDRGEEVRYLQWLLQADGWLFEEPDGVFGRRTEQAVREYQRYKGYEPTGVADDGLMYALDQDRIRLDKLHFGEDYYEPYPGSYVPPFETGADALADSAAGCTTTALRDSMTREYCPEHAALLAETSALTAKGSAAGWSEAGMLWGDAVMQRFGTWLDSYPDEARLDILAACAAWQAYVMESGSAMYAMELDAGEVERQLCLMQRYFAGTLCEKADGEPYDRDREFLPEEEHTGYGEYCAAVLAPGENVDILYCCDAHAALLNEEYERYFMVADPLEGLDGVCADWLLAVDELFEQWAASCDTLEIAEGVWRAEDHLHTLLEAMDAASGSAVGKLRLLQWECGRLCEWLNGGEALE